MTIDNRTDEQIVAETLVAHCEDHTMPVPGGSVKKIVDALRAAGRLAGEPTEAQVKIAHRAYYEVDPQGGYWQAMRAALVAAAGAVQEASCPERPGGRPCESTKPGHRMHWSNGPSAESDHAKLIADARALSEYVSEHIPGSRYKPMIDRLANALEACTVLPSSTVGEVKIADELSKHGYDANRVDYCECGEKVGGGMVEHQARAVVEAIGGESRGHR